MPYALVRPNFPFVMISKATLSFALPRHRFSAAFGSKLQQKIRVGNPFSCLFVFFFSDLGLAAPFFENRLKNA